MKRARVIDHRWRDYRGVVWEESIFGYDVPVKTTKRKPISASRKFKLYRTAGILLGTGTYALWILHSVKVI